MYIIMTIKNGLEFGFDKKTILKELVKGMFKGYNNLTEI